MFAPLDLVSSHPWRRVAFTTYALSLSFFEAVLLDALVRGGGREALILADVEGVSMALGERAGLARTTMSNRSRSTAAFSIRKCRS